MKDDNVIVLGTLKKEKSSKPFLVLFIFILLIGTCLAFPYIKAYLGDDFTLANLLNKNNTTTTFPVTTTTSTTTTTTTVQVSNGVLTCKYRNYSYEYTFDKDNKLIKIFNSYSFDNEDKTVYEDTLNTYISRSKDINNMGGNSKVINDDENNPFVFETIIDKDIDLSSIDVNYFLLGSNYNDVLKQLSGKGFDCK